MKELEEFWVDFRDGRKRRLWAPSFEHAADIAHGIGSVESMDYIWCLFDPEDPEYVPLRSGSELGIYG